MPDSNAVAVFIKRWSESGGSEEANAKPFFSEFCAVFGLKPPDPYKPINEDNIYSHERKIYLPRGDGSAELKKLDLYKRGCFVLESKQGQEVVTKTPLSLPIQGLTQSSAVKRGSRAWEDTMGAPSGRSNSMCAFCPHGNYD
ncbi:type IIL restriction-modification enzyme MmeI [Humidesulfovibrio sp.]